MVPHVPLRRTKRPYSQITAGPFIRTVDKSCSPQVIFSCSWSRESEADKLHDGICNNCNGHLPAQQSMLIMAGIASATVVAITGLRPHDDNTGLITLVLGLMTPMIAQLMGIAKTQEVHQALCDTAQASNAKHEEIKQLVVQDISRNAEIHDMVSKDLNTTTEVKQQLVEAKEAATLVKDTLDRSHDSHAAGP